MLSMSVRGACGRGFVRLSAILFLMSLVVTSPGLSQTCQDYSASFREATPMPLSESVTALVADQDWAIQAVGTTLHFLDIGNPDAVLDAASYDLGDAPLQIATADRLAAVATATSLLLLDWSTPSAPSVVQTMPLPAGTLALTRTGGRLLVSRGAAGVDLYQADAGTGLTFLGNADTPGNAQDAAVHQGWLIVADTTALLCWDITDPGSPVLTDTYDDTYQYNPANRDVARVEASDQYLVAWCLRWEGEEWGGLATNLDLMEVDAGGVLSLVEKAWFGSFDQTEAQISGDVLHVSDLGYRAIDLTAYPGVLQEISVWNGSPSPIAAGPATVLHMQAPDEISVYDVRNVRPVSKDPDWTGAEFHDIATGWAGGGFLLKDRSTWNGGERSYESYLYDIRDPLDVIALASESANSSTFIARITGTGEDGVLVTYGPNPASCRWYDLSTGSLVTVDLPRTGPAGFHGDFIFQVAGVMDGSEGLAILDASSPGSLTTLGFFPGSYSSLPIVLGPSTIALQRYHAFDFLDIADPSAPVLIGTLSDFSGAFLGQQNSCLFFAQSPDLLTCVDVSDPALPTVRWSQAGYDAKAMTMQGSQALLVLDTSPNSLQIVDLTSDSTGPVAIGPAFGTEASTIYGALWQNDIVYTAQMRVYDVSDPLAPTFLGKGPDADSAFYSDGERIVFGGGCYPLQCVTTTHVSEDTPGAGRWSPFSLSVGPNPFNPQTVVSFTTHRHGEAVLDVFDLSGRMIRRLVADVLDPGEHVATWDGNDDAGHAVGTGLYIARLSMGGRSESAKLMLLR